MIKSLEVVLRIIRLFIGLMVFVGLVDLGGIAGHAQTSRSPIQSEPDTIPAPPQPPGEASGRPSLPDRLKQQQERMEEQMRESMRGLGGVGKDPRLPRPAGLDAMRPSALPGAIPGGMPGAIPGGIPGGFPMGLPGGFPGAFPGTVPGAVPEGLSAGPSGPGGIRLRGGAIEHPVKQNLLVRDDKGAAVVAKYHVGIGDARFVLMPDGKLKVVPQSETSPTDEAFVPWTANQLRDAYLADPRLAKLNMNAMQSRHFVFIYNTSELFIKATRTILETMYPAVREYFSRMSIDVHEPEFPLVVIAFANDDQYQEFARMPPGVVAYYDTLGNHVALYEQSRLSKVAPEIAVKNAISTIAHEGVHQILHNIGVQKRLSRWPMWLSEGLPEYFAPTSVTSNAKWKGLGATNDLRMKEIVEDLSQGERLGSGQRLARLVDLDQLDSLDYAYAWGVIHWMARKHRDELNQCIVAASKLQPLNHIESKQTAVPFDNLYQTAMGTEHAAHERELAAYLGTLRWVDPAENQTHYLVISGSRITLTNSPETVEQIKSSTLPLQTFRVQKFPNRTAATQAMRQLQAN